MENGNPKKSSSLEWVLFALFLLALATQLTNEFNNPDGIGYYAHLRSAAVDRDLFHLNEFEALEMTPYFYSPSPTGYILNQWPVGSALLWSPFFLIERLAVLASGADAGGYSAMDALAITFASAFGRFSFTPDCRNGAVSMKTIRSTIVTSTRFVILISASEPYLSRLITSLHAE